MIALIGTHGVGKSSLLKAVKEQRPDLIINDGDSRVVKNFNKSIGNKLTDKEEQLLINTFSDTKWHQQVALDNLCLTRTPLDHYAYASLLGWHDLAGSRLNLFEESDWESIKFFYIPIEFDLEDDGVRYVDPDFQKEVDCVLRAQIKRFNINVIELSGSIENRVKTFIDNI